MERLALSGPRIYLHLFGYRDSLDYPHRKELLLPDYGGHAEHLGSQVAKEAL